MCEMGMTVSVLQDHCQNDLMVEKHLCWGAGNGMREQVRRGGAEEGREGIAGSERG